MVELFPKKAWVGHNLIELDLRKKYDLNVAAIKRKDSAWGYVDPNRGLEEREKRYQ